MQKKFPNDYPSNLLERIIEDGAKEQLLTVYRICNDGIINRDAFNSSFVDNKNRINTKKGLINRDAVLIENIGNYSTSCFEDYKEIKRTLRMMQKYHPEPIIAQGVTDPGCGLSLRITESKFRKRRGSHVDWWIYENTTPQNYFNAYMKEGE